MVTEELDMRVNINNIESIKVNNREEAIDIIKDKMKAWMHEGGMV